MNKVSYKSAEYKSVPPMSTKNPFYNCIPNPVVDGLLISTADEELVLQAKRRQMVTRSEVVKVGRKLPSTVEKTLQAQKNLTKT